MTPLSAARLGLYFALFSLAGLPSHADPFYVSVYNNQDVEGSILKVDDTGTASVFATGFEQPEGIAFDSDRNLLVLDGDNIYKVDSSGTKHDFINPTTLGSNPAPTGGPGSGLAIDQSGNIYVAGNANGGFASINKYNSSGAFVSYWATGSSLTQGMAFDSSGNLIAAVAVANTVVSFAPDGTPTELLNDSTSIANPVGIAIDSTGKVFVTGDDSKAYFITPTGDLTEYATVIGCECTMPNGIVFDSTGKMFMANADSDGDDNSITVTQSDGGATSIYTPLSATEFPNFLAMEPAAVPEPGVSGALLAALGLGAILLRRRMTK